MSGFAAGRYPVTLDLAGRLVVVVGGAPGADAKALSLAGFGADVVLISARPAQDALAAEADGVIQVRPRGYVRGDLEGAAMAVIASGSREIDEAVDAEALERGVLVESLDTGWAAGRPQVTALFGNGGTAEGPTDQGEDA